MIRQTGGWGALGAWPLRASNYHYAGCKAFRLGVSETYPSMQTHAHSHPLAARLTPLQTLHLRAK